MVLVSPQLYFKHISLSPILQKVSKLLENDEEVDELLKMSNVMAVTRLKYNDHGVVHARIVAGTSIELLELLLRRNVELTTLRDGITKNLDEVKVIIFLSAYLHDIGNSIHRNNHEYIGALIAKDVVDRVLKKSMEVYDKRLYSIRQEILHSIYASGYETECLTVECSITKLADGLDMSEGRARIPYRLGKIDMHAVSALSIKKVDIDSGDRPIKVSVYMDDSAGLFQLENVLVPKILGSLIKDVVEIYIQTQNKAFKYYPRD
ncbi:MAG: HD domain-containing protein [Sulfolobales archaeon]